MRILKDYIQLHRKLMHNKRFISMSLLTLMFSNYASAAGLLLDGAYSGTVAVVEAISGIMAFIGAFTIFWKMIHGDNDVRKAIIMVVGGCVTIMALEIIIPRIF